MDHREVREIESNTPPSIYCDGSCINGKGAYSIIITLPTKEVIIGKQSLFETTNNRMELEAVIFGITSVLKLKIPKVIIYSDSKYVIDGASEWMYKWQKKNWKLSINKKVKNQDLWIQLFDLVKSLEIQWSWQPRNSNRFLVEVDSIANRLASEVVPSVDFKNPSWKSFSIQSESLEEIFS